MTRVLGNYVTADRLPAVRFTPCEDRPATQFNGMFLIAGPGCARLAVAVGENRRSNCRSRSAWATPVASCSAPQPTGDAKSRENDPSRLESGAGPV